MKKFLVLIITLSLALTGCSITPEEPAEPTTEPSVEAAPEDAATGEEAPVVDGPQIEISIEGYGIIKATLDPSAAPISVENFVNLINEGFYDGLTFHRIIDGFMMQGGDPTGTGSGSAETKIKGEFAQNGVENPISHTSGVLSMARSQDMDSASCQFFIVHEDSTFLDGAYAGFGHVTEGMDVVDAICKGATVEDSNGTVLAENQPVIEYIKVVG